MKKILTFTAVALFMAAPAFAMDDHGHGDVMKKNVMADKMDHTKDSMKDTMAEKEGMVKDAMMKDKMEDVVEHKDDTMMKKEKMMDKGSMLDKPAVYIAAFAADWCGTCKELEPKISAAAGGFEATDLQVVKFDLTDATTSAAAAVTAAEHNWSEIFTQNAPKTGFALLIDGETNEVLAKISNDMSADDIKNEIKENI